MVINVTIQVENRFVGKNNFFDEVVILADLFDTPLAKIDSLAWVGWEQLLDFSDFVQMVFESPEYPIYRRRTDSRFGSQFRAGFDWAYGNFCQNIDSFIIICGRSWTFRLFNIFYRTSSFKFIDTLYDCFLNRYWFQWAFGANYFWYFVETFPPPAPK